VCEAGEAQRIKGLSKVGDNLVNNSGLVYNIDEKAYAYLYNFLNLFELK
jgi:hypothetical protein